MTELTDRDPGHPDDTDWLVSDEPTADEPAGSSFGAPGGGGRRTALVAVGLVAAGALVGGVGVAALRPHTTSAASTTGFGRGLPPGAQGLPGQGGAAQGGAPQGGVAPGQGGFASGPGGVDGEQHLSGTVTAVGSSTVTIRTASGTTKYAVTSQTEVVRNGAVASLSSIRPGDSVFVHLIPTSGTSYVVERLFAQSAGASNGTGQSSSTGTTT
jgi:hypothetical protein